ncbi:MAG: hypothetical protein AB7G68_12445 [Nitrospiraceae bacterium]
MNLKADTLEPYRIRQGDIVRDVDCIEYAVEKEGIIEVSRIIFPLVVVLTQDCDLEQDFKIQNDTTKTIKDKLLISALVAPLYNAEHVYQGTHLSELAIGMEIINKKRSPGNFLRNNERPRYHYLEFPDDIPVVPSIIDFKHYFSVNVNHLNELKLHNYVCTLSPLYREDICQRFASYLSRIGLPDVAEKS